MKFWMLIAVCCLAVSAGAQTYRAGGAARANFGAQQETEEKEESSVPGARSNVQTRTFSNYSSRQPREWSKGVQTQGVRTSTAGSAEYVDKADERAARAAEALGAGKKEAAAPAGKKTGRTGPGAAQAASKGSADAVPADASQTQDPNALLQQVQGMLQGLGAASSAGGAASGGNAAAGKSAGAVPSIPGMPAGMNVPGMPDVSALMNAAAAGAQPAKK